MRENRWTTIQSLKKAGCSIKTISQRLGLTRKTVSKYLQMAEPPAEQERPSILDPYHELIDELVEKGMDNCVVIQQKLMEKGYEGSLSTIQRYVKPKRPAQLASMPAPLVETEPGEEFQVDWGDFSWETSRGVAGKVYAFVIILSWSRMRYVEFTFDMTCETLIRCHLNAFGYLGGVPRKGLYDNMKTVVTTPGKRGERALHVPFKDFADTQGFEIDLCPVRWPRRKGKVERGVSYVRSNLWPQLEHVGSLDELNRRALMWCDTVNGKVHGSTREIPMTRWLKVEKPLLSKVRPFTPYTMLKRKVSRNCFVTYMTNRYSVPHEHAGREVGLQICGERLDVLVDGKVVRVHHLSEERNRVIDVEGDQDELRKLVSERLQKRRRKKPERPPLIIEDDEEVEMRDLSEYEWEGDR